MVRETFSGGRNKVGLWAVTAEAGSRVSKVVDADGVPGLGGSGSERAHQRVV